MKRGIVKWFSPLKGFGFIVPDEADAPEVFVHYSAIEGEGYRNLVEGDTVEYELASAAAFYAIPEKYGELLVFWQWDQKWNKKSKHDRVRQLVIAGALIAAEIDRLGRLPKTAVSEYGEIDRWVDWVDSIDEEVES